MSAMVLTSHANMLKPFLYLHSNKRCGDFAEWLDEKARTLECD